VRSFRATLREPELLALVALQGLVFWRPLFFETFFFRDLHLLFYFQRLKVAESLASGHLPLWDSTLHGGQPLLANVNNTALYPGNLLFLVLPPLTAFNFEIVLHLALAGTATYVLARALDLKPPAALVAALVYEFCGPSLSALNLLNRLTAIPWTPLMFLFWHLFLVERRARWFAAAACVGAVQILAGFPELTVFTFALLGVWSLPAEASEIPKRNRLALLLGLVLTVAGLAAAQILPTLELLKHTERGRGLGAASAFAWSISPRRLPELVLPGWFGRVDTLSDADYWGRNVEDQGFPYLLSITFGTGAAVLALAGLGRDGGGGPSFLQRRVAGMFAGFALLVALGKNLPGISALVAAVPMRVFRYPVKFVCAAALPLAILAGAGAARTATAGRSLRLRFAAGAGLAAAILAGLAAAEATSSGFASRVALAFFALPSDSVPRGGVAVSLGHAALVSGMLAILLVFVRESVAWALPALVTADLLVASRGLNPTAPRVLLADPPQILAEVRRAVGRGSLYRVPEGQTVNVSALSNDVVWLAKQDLDTLARYTAAGFGIPIPFHLDFDSLARSEVMRVTSFVESLPWARRVPVLAASGVRAVLANGAVSAPGLEPVVAWSNGRFLYRVLDARPPARLEMANGYGRVVSDLVERPGVRRLETDSATPASLVLTTPYWEGWTAMIDGKSAEVRLANGFMQSVSLPVGRHVVLLRYWPPGLTAGLVISAASALLMACLALVARKRA
jgi:Bacterial membrane protein YfhO